MPSQNATIAVNLFRNVIHHNGWGAADAWKAIAVLLLSCRVFEAGGWRPFHGTVVHQERNAFELTARGPNSALRASQNLTDYLARELGVQNVCDVLGAYWNEPAISELQPNNLVGHAFRSIVAEYLRLFGNGRIQYEEEVDPRRLYPGFPFPTRSVDPKIDIVAFAGGVPVALISARWRFRHDRVDIIDEAFAYLPAARRLHPNANVYAAVGEMTSARLQKLTSNSLPLVAGGPLSGVVHFCPGLVTEGLGYALPRGHVLRSLEWLAAESHQWG